MLCSVATDAVAATVAATVTAALAISKPALDSADLEPLPDAVTVVYDGVTVVVIPVGGGGDGGGGAYGQAVVVAV